MPTTPPRLSFAFVGMMGSGKTSIGRLFAARAGLPFLDSDAEIERRAGRTVRAIFAEQGEAAFRIIERDTIAESLACAPLVLATGGGAMAEPETRALLLARSCTIWLDAPAEILFARISRTTERPLLGSSEAFAALLESRRSAYAEAALRIDAIGAPEVILARVIQGIREV